ENNFLVSGEKGYQFFIGSKFDGLSPFEKSGNYRPVFPVIRFFKQRIGYSVYRFHFPGSPYDFSFRDLPVIIEVFHSSPGGIGRPIFSQFVREPIEKRAKI